VPKRSSGNMQVPPKWAGQDKRFAESLKENLDVLSGSRGDPLDRAVTVRDLLESGIVTLSAGANFYSGASQDIIRNAIQYPNLGVPPAPTNLAANGAFQNILLTWDMEFYTGHAYYEIFRHTSDVVADATLAGTQSGFTGIYSDPVGGGSTYYYWVRAVNLNGVVGPFNSSTGTLGQTQIDIPFMLNLLSNQITSSQLGIALTTSIALIPSLSGSITALDAYTGYASGYTGDNLLTRIGGIDTGVSSLQSNVSTLNTSVGNLQTSVADLTSGVSSVYVQASQPTGTISTNSRWYDNDDNMKPYFYNGTTWIALDDPRITSNQVSINSLNAQVFNGDGTAKLATASALGVLDATVVVQGNSITSISSDVTALNNSVYNADGTLELATASALSTLSGTVTTQGNTISTVQTDITDLEGEVFNANGTSRLATGTALTGVSNSVSAIYDGANASVVKSVQTDITDLESEVFNADGTLRLATGTALSGLTNSVTAIYDGTNASVVKSVQIDVTALEGEVFNADGSARLATGSALTGVTNSVEAIYNGTNASVVKTVQTDITALEGQVFNADGSARLATGSALTGVTNSVEAIYDGTNASVVKTVQTDVTALEGEVFNANGTARLATGTALTGVSNSVSAIYNGTNASVVKSVQTDVTALEGEVFNANGTARLATGSALTSVSNDVSAIYDGGNASVVKSVQTSVAALDSAVFNANGSVKLATTATTSGITQAVEAIYDPNDASAVTQVTTLQGDIASLESEVFNANGTARLATGSAFTSLQSAVEVIYDADGNAGGATGLVASIQESIVALNGTVYKADGTTKLADADAFEILETEVIGTGNASASRIDGLQAAIYNTDGTEKLASAQLLSDLTAVVSGDNALVTKVDRMAASIYTNADTTGTVRLATSAQHDIVKNEVFPDGTSNASRLSQLSAAVWSGGDPDNDVVLASADFAENINAAVFGSPTGQTAAANKLEQLQVTIAGTDGTGGLTGAIATTQDIVANETTGLTAQYAVKIDAGNGAVSGFGLSTTTNDEGNTTSAFIVNANRFAIIDENGSGLSNPNSPPSGNIPFVYSGYQAPSAANGQVAVPAGVYIDTAFIANGSITTAQIGTATIDTANITGTLSANKIVGGKISTSLLNIDSSSITSQIINGTPTLVLGDVNVNKLTGNSISANIMSATTVYADKLLGDVNTLVPFRTFASKQYQGSETTMIEVELPASSHPLGHKPFAICTGYIQPRFERVYRIKMYMKTATAVTSQLGQPIVASFTVGGGSAYRYLKFSGDISSVVSVGQVLRNYMAVKTGTVTAVSVSNNQTTINYSGNIFTTSDTISTTTSTNYVLVGESRTKAATATKLDFSVSGSKSVPDTGIVGLKITVTQYNSQDYYLDTYTSGIYINEVSGMIMGVR
jgi:hypothetical protein